MKAESKVTRLVLVSPWTLLVFLVLPLLVILSFTLHFRLPLLTSATPLLVNNVCFAFFVACRLLRYLVRMRNSIRYGAACCKPRQSVTLAAPVAKVRADLAKAGYSFDTDGSYCERRDLGYLGTTIMYGGLFILLAVGSWDNLRQFSGMLRDGMGPATRLNKTESYLRINKGPFAASIDSLPSMHIVSQSPPDSVHPKGTTGIALTDEDGQTRQFTLIPDQPVSYGAFDFSMTKLVFQPEIVIRYKDSVILFDELVTLDPLVQKRGPFSFYGLFQGAILGGGVYYQPEKSLLMVVITRGSQKVVTDLTFQVDQQVVQGDYILSCAKMGQWSEIEVVHRRHKGLLIIAGVITLIGLLLRIAARPRRLWLEEVAEGCTIWSSSRETMNLLQARV